MTMFKDIIYTNTEAIKKTISSLKDNYFILILTMFGLFLTDYIITALSISLAMAFAGGFNMVLVSLLTYIIMLVKLSFATSILTRISEGEKINLRNIFIGWNYNLPKLINYVFIAYVGGLIMDKLFSTGNFSNIYQADHSLLYLKLLLNLIVIFIFNASFETLYQTQNNGISIFIYGVKFFYKNLLQWLIAASLLVIAMNYQIFIYSVQLRYIVTYVLLPIILLYRAHLFKILDNSSIRMREFKRRID